MINFHDIIKDNLKEQNPNWSQIPDHPHRILKTGGSGSGKKSSLFNLIVSNDALINVFYAKDPCEVKYQFLINKSESTGSKDFNDSEAFIEYWIYVADIYKNIEECNPNKNRKILIVFDDMIDEMLSNKILYPVVTELFIRGRKLNISLFYYTVLFCCAKKYYNRLYALFYCENSKQTRTSTKCIYSFIRYWI